MSDLSKNFLLTCLFVLITAASSMAIEVHNFDCKNCHKVGISFTDLGNATTNICLQCHKANPSSWSMLDGANPTPTGLFAPTDASNAMSSYPGALAPGEWLREPIATRTGRYERKSSTPRAG